MQARDLKSIDNRLVHLAIEIAVCDSLQLEVRVTFLQQQQQQQQHDYITDDVKNFIIDTASNILTTKHNQFTSHRICGGNV